MSGNLYIKPVSHSIDFNRLGVSESIDLVVTNGDIGNRDDPESLTKGREFFRRVSGAGASVVAIPGNHDPLAATRGMVEGVEEVVCSHESVLKQGTSPR